MKSACACKNAASLWPTAQTSG
uniref:Uncharacterized protein n=1 Tax=Anguilla anguilla TaxID=7936 RepID=A0A0E9TJI9_ANGAN